MILHEELWKDPNEQNWPAMAFTWGNEDFPQQPSPLTSSEWAKQDSKCSCSSSFLSKRCRFNLSNVVKFQQKWILIIYIKNFGTRFWLAEVQRVGDTRGLPIAS